MVLLYFEVMNREHSFQPVFAEQLSLLGEAPELSATWNSHHSYLFDSAKVFYYNGEQRDFENYYDRQNIDIIEVCFKGLEKFETHKVKIIGEPLDEASKVAQIICGVVQVVMVDKSRGY